MSVLPFLATAAQLVAWLWSGLRPITLGGPSYFVDLLVGLFRVLLGVGLRLLLQAEVAHAILPWLVGLGRPRGWL